MGLTNKVKLMDVGSIYVERDARQRSEIDVTDLLPSVRKRGVIQPILVHADGKIIAGERRWTAAKAVGLPKILARIAEEHDPFELQMLEFEENFVRKELPWQDRAKTMKRMWELFLSNNPGGSQEAFAEFMGYSQSLISQNLSAAEEIEKGNARVLSQPSIVKAVNVVRRERERKANNDLADIMDSISMPASGSELPPVVQPQPEAILNVSFHDWARSYTGPKFNLLHCDFPYGVDLQDSEQVGGQARQLYDDSEAVYWKLLDTLAETKDNIISSSAHVFFWFSMEFYIETMEFLSRRLPEFTFVKTPLVWWKTDNKGIAPDVERRPRQVTEFCLFGWRGDRKLVKLASNAYGAPKANSNHVSEKPEPVLRHFFQLAVDSHTRLLDPTCGSGSALRAAESLGASQVLGLELDQEFAEDARAKLKSFRALAAVKSA